MHTHCHGKENLPIDPQAVARGEIDPHGRGGLTPQTRNSHGVFTSDANGFSFLGSDGFLYIATEDLACFVGEGTAEVVTAKQVGVWLSKLDFVNTRLQGKNAAGNVQSCRR